MKMNFREEIIKHKFVIFASDHYQTLGVVRSLGEKGIKSNIILHPKYSNHPYLCPNSKYVGEVTIVNSVEEGYDCLLKKYGNELNKPFLYSCDDWVESYLDLHYEDIKDRFFLFNGKKSGIVTKYMDKDAISKLAEDCGGRIPKSEVLKRGELPVSLKYPIITKSMMSISGGWKKDSFICYSPEELMTAYNKIKSETVLVEEFIQKKNELCVDGFSINGGKNICIPFQATYLRLTPTGYSNYMTIEPLQYKKVKKHIADMLSVVGFNGIFSVEYLIGQDDELYFLEVNFRNSTWSYAYTVGGVNLPYEWALATLMGGKIDSETIKPRTRPFKAIAETSDYVQFVSKGKISLFRWLMDVLSADCRFLIVFSDMKPIFVGLLRKIKQMLCL